MDHVADLAVETWRLCRIASIVRASVLLSLADEVDG